MSAATTPDWINQIKADEHAESLRAALKEQTKSAAMLRVDAAAPEFFANLIRELHLTVAALGEISLRGSICPLGAGSQQGARIEVGLNDMIPRHTWTNIFYTKGEAAIAVLTLEGNMPSLAFAVSTNGTVGVLAGSSFEVLDCRSTAELIVKRMVQIVKS
jgi:hypothetical protein